MSLFRRIVATNAPAAVLLVRLLVGGVFLSRPFTLGLLLIPAFDVGLAALRLFE